MKTIIDTENGKLDWIKGHIVEQSEETLSEARSVIDIKSDLAATFMSGIIAKYGVENPAWNSEKSFDMADAFVSEFEKRYL